MFKLALRNILRQKSHTKMTLATIIFGVMGIILTGGWVNDIFVKLGEALIHSQSGHIQIYKKNYYAEGARSPERFQITDPEKIKRDIGTNNSVDNVMSRLNFSGLLNNGHSDLPIIGVGIEPKLENKLGSSVTMIAGHKLTDQDKFGITIGQGVAETLKLTPGDYVTLLINTYEGALNSLDLKIIGVFQSFSNEYDARAIRIPLNAAQELLGTDSVNAIVILLKTTKDTDKITSSLKNEFTSLGLEIKTWIELNEYYGKVVELYKSQFGVLQIIILIMVLLSVANSVNMSIFDRTGEFGTMMALGNRSNHIFQLIVSECILLGLIGCIIGIVLGLITAHIISSIGIPMPPPPNANIGYTAQIQIVPSVLLLSFIIGLSATVLAAILPAKQVSKTPVVEALRQNI